MWQGFCLDGVIKICLDTRSSKERHLAIRFNVLSTARAGKASISFAPPSGLGSFRRSPPSRDNSIGQRSYIRARIRLDITYTL